MKPNVIVITGYGVNCEEETSFAFDMAGANSKIVHINDLIENKNLLNKANILSFPGGFSYGDDTGSGKGLANKIKNNLFENILNFIEKDKLVVGICNGFQVLLNLGLLPAINKKYGEKEAALIHNENNKFECRWVDLVVNSKKCVFIKEIENLHIPVAHGEGNFYATESILKKLNENDQIVFRYKKGNTLANGEFPYNPNGSLEDIAGICDSSGKILGMMPHPERAIFMTSHPEFQQIKEEKIRKIQSILQIYNPALQIFKNAVNYFE